MADIDVRIHLAGVREVFNDPGVQADLMRRAQAIKASADALMPEGGYDTAEHHIVERGVSSRGIDSVVVITATNEAKGMQARHSTLTKALDAGRT